MRRHLTQSLKNAGDQRISRSDPGFDQRQLQSLSRTRNQASVLGRDGIQCRRISSEGCSKYFSNVNKQKTFFDQFAGSSSLLAFLETECRDFCAVVRDGQLGKIYRKSCPKTKHLDHFTRAGERKYEKSFLLNSESD